MEPIVRAHNLSYQINDKKLFHGITFDLFQGKALHIQGENGSGKTSLLKIVCGLTKPTKGFLKLKSHKKICFIGHKNALKQYLSIDDNLALMNIDNHKDIHKYLSIFDLDKSRDINIANLSFGQQKKIALLRLFLNNSDLLILDEPCVGLDINSQKILEEFLNQELLRGKVVIFSSHISLDIVSDSLSI